MPLLETIEVKTDESWRCIDKPGPNWNKRDIAESDWLAAKGYDPLFGARPLARIIQEHIKKPLAEELLFGSLAKGGIVRVSVDKEADKLAFTYIERPPATPAEPKEAELVE